MDATRHIDDVPLDIEPDAAYRALVSRDARFDGRFFIGVTSTGVYCRPVCPAPKPHRSRVRFYPCAAAAERAGFRPCRRCRPESAPGSPAWAGTSSVVARALRLIGEGALDDARVEVLAGRLGVGPRHLRRLFERHLGASPTAVARSRRAHFAKRLIDDTEMTMAEIAFAAGFGSVRRFNTTMRTIFDRAPSQIRRAARTRRRGRDAAPSPPGTFRLRVPVRAPFDWAGVLEYLGARAIPGVEQVTGGRYRRAFRLDPSVSGTIEVALDARGAALEVCVRAEGSPTLFALGNRLRRLFDLDTDVTAIDAHLATDPLLEAAIARRPGQRLPGAFEPFELCVRAIVGQQVTVKAATTVTGRIAERHGTPVGAPDPGWPQRAFPTPAELARGDLTGIGMPGARARAITEVARRVADGAIALDGSRPATDVRRALLEVPGIGPWTADYVLARTLGEPDSFLPDDLGVRQALGNGHGPVTPREAMARAEAWRPWRAYGMLYLWRRLSDGRPKETRRRR